MAQDRAARELPCVSRSTSLAPVVPARNVKKIDGIVLGTLSNTHVDKIVEAVSSQTYKPLIEQYNSIEQHGAIEGNAASTASADVVVDAAADTPVYIPVTINVSISQFIDPVLHWIANTWIVKKFRNSMVFIVKMTKEKAETIRRFLKERPWLSDLLGALLILFVVAIAIYVVHKNLPREWTPAVRHALAVFKDAKYQSLVSAGLNLAQLSAVLA